MRWDGYLRLIRINNQNLKKITVNKTMNNWRKQYTFVNYRLTPVVHNFQILVVITKIEVKKTETQTRSNTSQDSNHKSIPLMYRKRRWKWFRSRRTRRIKVHDILERSLFSFKENFLKTYKMQNMSQWVYAPKDHTQMNPQSKLVKNCHVQHVYPMNYIKIL